MTCPDCEGKGTITLNDCSFTCQRCKGGKTVPSLPEWWAMLDTAAALRERVAQLEAVIAYIDAHAPLADTTCNEPGITLSEAARRAMSEAQP